MGWNVDGDLSYWHDLHAALSRVLLRSLRNDFVRWLVLVLDWFDLANLVLTHGLPQLLFTLCGTDIDARKCTCSKRTVLAGEFLESHLIWLGFSCQAHLFSGGILLVNTFSFATVVVNLLEARAVQRLRFNLFVVKHIDVCSWIP